MAKQVNIKIKSDSKDAQNGIKNVTSELNKLSKGLKNNDVTKLSKSFLGVTAAVAGVSKAIKVVNAELQKNAEAYKTQATAEKQLETAAKNNPYLNSQSVAQLKNYASELQSISTMGDEQLLPFMAQLAAAGRTQTEIQEIMSAALDVSASGTMSFESAVKNLNKTFSGLSGELGESVPAIKALTKEELQSGKAVEILKKNYAGMAEEVAKATGSKQQLQNAIGDFREELGAPFEKAMSPLRTFFTELISGWTEAHKKRREYEGAKEANKTEETTTVTTLLTEIEGLEKSLEINEAILKSQKNLNKAQKARANVTEKDLIRSQEKIDKDKEHLAVLYEQLDVEREKEKAAAKAAEDEAAENQRKAQLKAEMDTRDKLRAEYDKTIEKQQREIEQRRKLGEEITAQEEAQILLNTATNAYIQMMSNEAFKGNNGNYQHEVDARAQIEQWAKDAAVTEGVKSLEDSDYMKDAKALISSLEKEFTDELKLSDQIENTITALQYEQLTLGDNQEAWQEYSDKIFELERLKTKVVQEEAEKQKEAEKQSAAELFANIDSYTQEFTNILNGITELARKNNEAETNEEMANISKQYTDGIISYEEYNEKKKEIDKKTAQEEYKLRMWEWSASLLQATANIAQGVSAALASAPPASYIMAALTAAAGAVQIASLTAAKPKPPSFATGGVVGGMSGASMGNDNTYIHARQGEMILNAAQQAQLWKVANGGMSGATVNMPVTIENRNGSNVQAQMSNNGLRVIVDNMVNTSMQRGNYTKSMNIATGREQGARIL